MSNKKHGLCGVCGVYVITNTRNGKQYVGASVDVGARINQHFNTAAKRYRHTNDFYKDITLLGREYFSYQLLEKCTPDNKIATEKKWYRMLNPQYNMVEPSDDTPLIYSIVQAKSKKACLTEQAIINRLISHRTESCRRKCKEGQRYKMISVQGFGDSDVTKVFESLLDAGRFVKPEKPIVAVNHIRQVINGERKKAYGFSWEVVQK